MFDESDDDFPPNIEAVFDKYEDDLLKLHANEKTPAVEQDIINKLSQTYSMILADIGLPADYEDDKLQFRDTLKKLREYSDSGTADEFLNYAKMGMELRYFYVIQKERNPRAHGSSIKPVPIDRSDDYTYTPVKVHPRDEITEEGVRSGLSKQEVLRLWPGYAEMLKKMLQAKPLPATKKAKYKTPIEKLFFPALEAYSKEVGEDYA